MLSCLKEYSMSKIQWSLFLLILTVVAVKIILLDPKEVHLLASKIEKISFEPVPLSKTDAEKSTLRISNRLYLTYENNRTVTYPLQYHQIAKMGEKIGGGTIGLLTDREERGLKNRDGKPHISTEPDGNSLITSGGRHFLITHLEEAPGALYETELVMGEGKVLTAIETKSVDLSRTGGSIIDCASSKTVYGSHLGGEENYAMNSRYADKASPFYIDCLLDGSSQTSDGVFHYFCDYVEGMKAYLNENNISKENGYNGREFTPYNYGYIIEVKPDENGSTEAAKHYVTGRYSPELAVMMPDHRTLYMSDDGNYKGFWKFVSDEPIEQFRKVWKGRLYAAKLTQLSDRNGGKFKVQWRELGHASDSEIKALIDKKMKLSDIFEIAKPDKNGVCPGGFKKINEDSAVECLKIKSGMHKAAAFLESRKYAAYLGATMEFRKGEGLSYDPQRNRLYFAISTINKSMEDDHDGEESLNDIRLPENICGAVYALDLDSNYSVQKMEAMVIGKPLREYEPFSEEYRCHPDAIANPDNIMYLGKSILVIGEDSRNHVNNMLWAYNINEKSLTRIASLPIGAEVTGLDKTVIEGKGLLLFNVQHPFADNPKNVEEDTPNEVLVEESTDEQKRAQIGYIGGIPKVMIFQ